MMKTTTILLILLAFYTSGTAQILWNPAASCNYTVGRTQPISAIAIHDTEGSYAGTISWFQNCSAQVSAHYVIRSSDGQVTQMVDDANKAWHIGSENGYTIGIEHEGYCSQTGWYTSAMYSSSACLVKSLCSAYGINPLTTYSGSACTCSQSSSSCLQSTKNVKGHQMFPNQTHTDPGPNWNWSNYYSLINNSSCTVQPLQCNNDYSCGPPSPLALNINSSCASTGCSTIGATPPTQNINFYGGSGCATQYQASRYDDDVWFTVVPANSNAVTITVNPTSNLSNFDVVVGVYYGNCLTPTQLTCADSYGVGTAENVTFTPISGTTYYIRVFSYGIGSTYSGNFDICAVSSCTPPSTPATPTSNSPQCGNVTLTRGTPPTGVTWFWQGTSCGTSMSNLSSTCTATSSGTYYLRAYNTTGSGCWSASCAGTTVTVSSPPNVSINPSSQSGCVNQNVTFSATGAGSYVWNSQCPSGNCSYSTPNTYTVTVTGTSNGCSASATATLIISDSPTNPSAFASPNPVCANSALNLTANVTKASSYVWSGPSGFNSSQQTTSIPGIQASQAGIYTVTASNLCGSATASVNVTVTQPPATPAPTVNINPVCEGSLINLSVSGGNSWQWNGPGSFSSTQQNPIVNTAIYSGGNYCVVASQNGCQSQQGCINVNVNPKPVFTIQASNNNNNVFCAGQQLNLTTGNCSYGYLWSSNAASSSGCSTTAIPVGSQTYTATATDGNNCTASSSVSVSTSPMVTPAISSITQSLPNPVCAGGSVTFTVNAFNGGSNPIYAWSSTDGQSGTGSPFTLYNLQNNIVVNCTLTSDAVCASTQTATATKSVTVQQPQPIAVSVTTPSATICTGETVTFSAQPQGAGTYTWYVNGQQTQENTSNILTIPNVTSDIDVYCILTASQTCVTGSPAQSANVQVSVQTQAQTSANINVSPSTSICANTAATFTAVVGNGGSNPAYAWLMNGAPAPGNSSSSTYTNSNLQNGSVITCVITSSSVCVTNPVVTTNVITMNVNPLPVVTVTNDTTVCAGSPVAIAGAGGITCHWNPAPGLALADTGSCNPLIIAASTTAYTFVTTDNNNCSASDSVKVTVIAFPDLTITPPSPIICGFNSVGLSVQPSGTAYSWSGPGGFSGNTQTMSVNTVGQYSVTVTDPGICTGSATATINVTAGNPPLVNAGNNQSIYNGATVTLGANPTAQGNSPFTYNWQPTSGLNSGSLANPVATPTATTIYTVTVTDANNCSATGAVTVTVISCDTSIHPIIAQNLCHISVPQYNEPAPPYNSAKYKWTLNGGLAPGNDSLRFYDVTATGSYTCKVNIGICATLYSNDQYVNTSTCEMDIAEFEGSDFSIVPNPSNGLFTLSYDVEKVGTVEIKVFDVFGQLVNEEKLTKVSGSCAKKIDLRGVAKGAYLLQLNAGGKIFTKRIEVL